MPGRLSFQGRRPRYGGLSDELKVTRMQGRRMHAHQRDCVPKIVNGYHRVSVDIVSGQNILGRHQRRCELDHVLARIKTRDGDCADLTGRSLVEDESILAYADRYLVVKSDMNAVVAVADRYRIQAAGKHRIIVAITKGDAVPWATGHPVVVAVAKGDCVVAGDPLGGGHDVHRVILAVAEGDCILAALEVGAGADCHRVIVAVAEGDCVLEAER